MMTDQDLYWYVNRLRKNIGDNRRDVKVIANRRNFGYFLDLTPASVKITGSASGVSITPATPEPESKPEPEPISEERPVPLLATDATPTVESPRSASSNQRQAPLALGRKTIAILAATLLTALLATAWSATRATTEVPAVPNVPDRETGTAERPSAQKGRKGNPKDRPPSRPRRIEAAGGSVSGKAVVAAPAAEDTTAQDLSTSTSGSERPASKQPTQQLPPPPTRFLFHLVHPDTGDHFVTTDPATSSEREAAGYVGGAIARVYTDKQPGTKAISTNHGRAYVFIDAGAETSPRTETAPLWFVSDGAGDFFYATRQADIPRDGWSASLIGYVGAQ
jgi:hypothetical protein